MNRAQFWFLAVALTPWLSGCKLNLGSLDWQKETSSSLTLPSCTLTSPLATVNSGDSISLSGSISNGTVPYTLKVGSQSIDLSPQFSFNHVFLNEGTSTAPQTFSFAIADANGLAANCSVTVNVLPSTSPAPELTCTTTVSPASPEINQPVTVQLAAKGGEGADTFSSLIVGSGTISSDLQAIDSSHAAATVLFPAAGSIPITGLVTDANGHSAACSLNLAIRSPGLTVATNPESGTAPAGTPITVSISATDFPSGVTPSFYFYTSESGVQISQSGASATVTATDGSAHDFVITVAAFDPSSGDVATGFAHLVFTSARLPLSCTVTISARGGTLYPVLPFYYYYYGVTATIPSASGAVNPRITNVNVDGITYAAYNESPLALAMYFSNSRILEPAQRTVSVELMVEDDTGRSAVCDGSASVWLY